MNQPNRHDVRLEGCTSSPLANYLKALGVFRIIAEQVDSKATAWWEGNTLRLCSILDKENILNFFADTYSPTPVIAPWNGGSGFHPGENHTNIDRLLESNSERYLLYRTAISTALEAINELSLSSDDKKQFKEDLKAKKGTLLQYLRNNLSDEALSWLDAVVLLTTHNPQYPPLLGTGGNDGRLDFTANFMKRLDTLFVISEGMPQKNCYDLLDCALFGTQIADLPQNNAIGQFYPGAAGGVNMATSYEANPLNNTWDFVLMIEGALMFAASCTKRLNAGGQESLSYPFCVYTSSAAYSSAASSDEESSRAELWVPLWLQASTLAELKILLSEGRVQVGRNIAVRGVDFARAISTLGTDRGITSFRRFGFQERNGLAYLAVDLGLWTTQECRSIHLLKECERWIERFRRCANGKNAPQRFTSSLNRYNEAVMNACRSDGYLTTVIKALGNIERVVTNSPRTATDNHLSPLSRLSSGWIESANDGSPEFRLACALASIRGSGNIGALRYNMIPCNPDRPWLSYDPAQMDKPHVVWKHGNLVDNLLDVLRRRCMDAERQGLKKLPLYGTCPASIHDVLAFIRGDIDEKRIEAYLWGLNAVDWQYDNLPQMARNTRGEFTAISPCYALLKLTHATVRPDGTAIESNAPGVPYDPAILAQAAAGSVDATRTAVRRLKSSGWKPLVEVVTGAPNHIRRCAAAVLFPIHRYDFRLTARAVMHFSNSTDVDNRTEKTSVAE